MTHTSIELCALLWLQLMKRLRIGPQSQLLHHLASQSAGAFCMLPES